MSKTNKNPRAGQRVWRGVTATGASLLALSICATTVVDSFRTDIDKFLGTQSTQFITDTTDDEPAYTYASDYASTTELLDAIEDLGERMNEEGSVLLKNNGALPLTAEETQKLSLLGFSSYYPVMGGDMGSSLSVNEGTDADTVDFVQALTAKGFAINTALQQMYQSLEASFTTEIESWGGTTVYTRITAPSIGGTFSSKEPSQAALNGANADWVATMDDYNTMIITIARAAGENRDYTPGADGVDPTQSLNQTDPLGLSDDERQLIDAAVAAKASNGGKVIVLLNNASAMEIEEIAANDGVDAILQIGLPGGYGFYGVADILSGAANPSGHLTDTYAVAAANSPAAQNYGNLPWSNINESYSNMNSALVEAEGIYTGYKYYETRYFDTVAGQGNAADAVGSSTGSAWAYADEVTYPFGYGLSYTTFTQTLDSVNVDLDAQTVTAQITVTNTGSVAGKDVAQLYASVPYTDYDKQNGIEKSAIQLLDYGKTAELAPGASETLTLVADAEDLTSWDSASTNAAGTTGNFILDPGTYYFTVGNGSNEATNNVLAAQGYTTANGMTAEGNAANVVTWELAELDNTSFARTKNGTAVENQLADMDLNYWMPGTVTYLTRNDWAGTWPQTYENLTATDEMLDYLDNDTYEITANGDPASVTFGAQNGLTLADLKGVSDMEDPRWSSLLDQILLEDTMIRTGFGGTSTKAIESIMSPEVIQNDGPNGINSYTLGQYANTDAASGDPCAVDANDPNLAYRFGTMCNETVIAQTFSKALAAEYGSVIGNYSLWSNLTIFWGAGTNLHRLPYNARNHEYYSEDPILTDGQAAAYIAAGKNYGVIIAPKHFAFNDTEVNRSGVAAFMTEQKARETDLRAVQGCIEDAGALGVMTTFNRIGVTAGNAHYGLLMNILRGEWGFMGLMSEDFIQDASYSVLKEAVHCGVTMTCNTGESTTAAIAEKWSYWTVDNVGQDATLMQDLKNVMTWQNYAIANSNAMDGMTSNTRLVSVRTWYDNTLTAVTILFGVISLGAAAMYVMAARKKKQNV